MSRVDGRVVTNKRGLGNEDDLVGEGLVLLDGPVWDEVQDPGG